MSYRVLPHTADTGIEGTAETLDALIAVMSLGMFELVGRCKASSPRRWLTLTIDAGTVEDLLVDTLSELLYLSETEDLLFCDFQVSVEPAEPAAKVEVGGVPTSAVEPAGPPIKAVTYHDLVVERREGRWYGRVYFDV
jgi:SHS2 domain-containing protein